MFNFITNCSIFEQNTTFTKKKLKNSKLIKYYCIESCGKSVCNSLALFLEPYSRSATQYSPLLNDGQEKSSSAMRKLASALKLISFIYLYMELNSGYVE